MRVSQLSLIVLELLLLPFASHLVLAAHFNCTWVPGPGSPAQYSYRQLCEASVITAVSNGHAVSAEYSCEANRRDVKVAEWRGGLFSWLKPCGDYGRVVDKCLSSHFAMCLGSECRYMASQDDCQWPHQIAEKDLPTTITVWYHLD